VEESTVSESKSEEELIAMGEEEKERKGWMRRRGKRK
jgi:hypothetical protein